MGGLLRVGLGARFRQVLGDANPGRHLTVEGLAQDDVHDRYQRGAGEEERAGVEQGQTQADRRTPPAACVRHGMRYPAPGTVSMIGGSPSFRRSVMMMKRTTPVNG